jgi:hypothetical protein
MKKNLLFTSAGDRSKFYDYWCENNRTYDIFLCYYGNSNDKPHKKYVDYYCERKGGKFQNFNYYWENNNQENLIESNNETKLNLHDYDKYFILDDDIIISTNDINELFEIIDIYDLNILQPSFSSQSVISHNITKCINNAILHYTNFIEVNTMMFKKEILEKCMKIYDNTLVGWGIDHLFMWYLEKKEDKYAIIDKITCINPHGERDIEKLENTITRKNKWDIIKKKNNIIENKLKTFKIIYVDKKK